MPRFLFYIPSRGAPTGGINVIIDWSIVLAECGFKVLLFTNKPNYQYKFVDKTVDILYLPELESVFDKRNWKQKTAELMTPGRLFTHRGFGSELKLLPDDIVVVPEFVADVLPGVLKQQKCILLAQDVFAFLGASLRPNFDINRFSTVICTSKASADAVRTAFSLEPHVVPLVIDPSEFSFQSQKKPLMTYLPRKLPEHSLFVTSILRNRGNVKDFDIRRLENMSRQEFKKNIHEAAIFLSFSHNEGFGLPPAEAMAAGSIVIGYTGVGGNEFFKEDIGFPIAQSDIVEFVRTIESVCEQYRSDPSSFDEMRRRASDYVLSTYSATRQKKELLSVFSNIGS